MTGVFLEENLVLSMLHKDQVVSDSLIGGFEPSLELENTVLRSPMVGTLGRCNEEANNLLRFVMQAHSSFHIDTNSKVVEYRELVYSGPKYPSGFEEYIGVVGPFTWGQVHCTSNKNLVLESSLAKGNEADQSYGESHCSMSNSIKKVSQPALLDSESILQREDNEDMVSNDEDLMEAQVSWDLGKVLGLQVSNERAMVSALAAKVQECQDFVLPRRRDRPRKNKG